MLSTEIWRDVQTQRASVQICLPREATENPTRSMAIPMSQWVWAGQRRRNSWFAVVVERYLHIAFHLQELHSFPQVNKEDPPRPFTGWEWRSNHQRSQVPGAVSLTKAYCPGKVLPRAYLFKEGTLATPVSFSLAFLLKRQGNYATLEAHMKTTVINTGVAKTDLVIEIASFHTSPPH